MATAVHVPTMTKAERANQRNAVLAGFLGWTLDAFDFFILTLVIDDIAKSFGRTRPDIALTLTVALAARPIGAVIFGIMADRFGRRLPLMINYFHALSFNLSTISFMVEQHDYEGLHAGGGWERKVLYSSSERGLGWTAPKDSHIRMVVLYFTRSWL